MLEQYIDPVLTHYAAVHLAIFVLKLYKYFIKIQPLFWYFCWHFSNYCCLLQNDFRPGVATADSE